MPGQVQSSYQTYPDVGFPGQIAQGSGPYFIEEGPLYVPSGGRKPRPGDALCWDSTQNAFKIPTDNAESGRVLGILSYRVDTVANAASILEYEDGDSIQICVFGTLFVKAGGAVEYGDRIEWNRSDYDWDPAGALANADVANISTGSGTGDVPTPTAATAANATALAAALNSLADNIVSALNAKLGAVAVTCVNRDPQSSGATILARVGYGRII